ncbi:MAG: hypothetical protein Q9192_003556 [Flavoplaca navasiana]
MNPVHPPFQLPGEPGNIIYGYPEGFNPTNATEAAVAASASSSQVAASAASSTEPTYLRTTPTPGVRDVNYPPYVINNVHGDLAVHAVSPNATHADEREEYDIHNLYGLQILNATYNALLAAIPRKRPFIIDRSTFSGAGKYAGLWGGAATVNGVFPGTGGKGEVYYDWYTLTAQNVSTPGANVTIDAPLGHIHVYVRGGYVIPTQEPALVTRDARNNPWGVIAALSLDGTASGNLYVDDGESVVQRNGALFVEFTATHSSLYAAARGTYNDTNPLANITVLGVQNPVSNVTLNGVSVDEEKVNFNESTRALVMMGLNELTSGKAWMQDWVLRWG